MGAILIPASHLSETAIKRQVRAMEKLEAIKTTDHLLIEEVASYLCATILCVTEVVWRSYDRYDEIVKRLKLMIRNQVEVVGQLNEMQENISLVASAQKDYERWERLRDLNYTVNYLTMDLMSLFDDSEYSTWNILNILDVTDFSFDERLPQWLLEHVLSASADQAQARKRCPKGFDVALSQRGISQQQIVLVETLIGQMLDSGEKYRLLIGSFYKPDLEPASIIYLVHIIESLGATMLSAALLFSMLLQPIMVTADYQCGDHDNGRALQLRRVRRAHSDAGEEFERR